MIADLGELVASGRMFDLVFVVIAVEMVALFCARAMRRVQSAPLDVYANLLAAASLLGAMHCVLASKASGYAAALLLCALMSHVAALRSRWRATSQPSPSPIRSDSFSRAQFSGDRR